MPELGPPNELMSRVTNIAGPKGLVKQAVENGTFVEREAKLEEEKIERVQAKGKRMRFMINSDSE